MTPQNGGVNIHGPANISGDVVGRDKIIYQAAPAPTVLNLHQLPPPPSDFTGRAAELAEMRTALHTGGVSIAGLHGMGGVGKTTLALKLAQELKPHYPAAQFYLDLTGASDHPLTPADAMAHVIRGWHPTTQLPEDEAGLRGLYCSVLDGQRALLLMDNAKDAAQVEPLIPPVGCVLLVTSRRHFTLPGLYAKDLNTLSPAEARAFLLRLAARIDGQADTIAKLCGYLPLALRLAGSALIEYQDLSPEEYRRQLQATQTRLNLVDASLSLSYQRLAPELQSTWRKLAVFPGTFDATGGEAVGEDPGHKHLSELVKYSLVEYDATITRYSLHDLARLFADSQLESVERAAAQMRYARHYANVLAQAQALYMQGAESILRGLKLFDLERSNIQTGQAWAADGAGQDNVAAQMCSDYAEHWDILNLRLHPQDYIRWLEAALAAARQLQDRRAEGTHLGHLGIAHKNLGEVRRAIEFYEQQLAITREIGDRRGEGNALSNLGVAYRNLGEVRRAIEFHEQRLVIARELGDRRGEGKTLGNLGVAYKNLGDVRRAIEFYEQRRVIAREIGDRRGEGAMLDNLGLAYAELGETRRAIEFYEQRLAIAREMGDRRGEGIVLGNLGLAYIDLGEAQRALEFCEQRLSIAHELGDRRGEGHALFYMARALDKLGNRAQAVTNAQAALKIYEQIEDPNAAKVREWLQTDK